MSVNQQNVRFEINVLIQFLVSSIHVSNICVRHQADHILHAVLYGMSFMLKLQ